ncbi:ABC transporter [Citrobacter koseri]|uniref:ABC transporter n=1 Tax=Citrobacter koseri TaxID=545 RepID=UPI0006656BD5|nr:ABC transporter [Citrobacter koseri]
MVKFFIIWSVFSAKSSIAALYRARGVVLAWAAIPARKILHYGHMPTLLRLVCIFSTLGLGGRRYRLQSIVATENFRCLTGKTARINMAWITARRRLLEEGATRGQNRALLKQIQTCSASLDNVVAPLHHDNIPVILAPMHSVSDVLAAMVGAGITPGKASVVISSSAERFNEKMRKLGGLQLTYCSIHQQNKALASNLVSLIIDVAEGRQNMIIFPDVTPDFTLQAEGMREAKLSCALFGRAARLHQGGVRLSKMINAQVVFYNLFYDEGLKIRIHPPVKADNVASVMPEFIENTIREYPMDWLLWHSHSLYFINH